MTAPLTTISFVTAGFWIYGVAEDSPFVTFYIVITVVLMALAVGANRKLDWPRVVLWGLVAIGVGNLAGGVLLVDGQPLYVLTIIDLGDGNSLEYDKFFHAFATGVATWVAHVTLAQWTGTRRGFGLAAAAVFVASGAGAFVEIVEYTGSIVFEQTNVGDYDNNLRDLIANLIGSIIAVSTSRWWGRSPSRSSLSATTAAGRETSA